MPMIIIEDKIISDALVEEHFICNLKACKGACCVAGDGGAPLEEEELGILDDIYDDIETYLTEAGKEVIKKQGKYIPAPTGDYTDFSTPLINGAACAYINYNKLGIAECAIQKAYQDGIVDFEKPISCHLYPIRITKYNDFEAVNYNEWEICKAACQLGKEQQVPLYQFLKAPLIRKYGTEFYRQLDEAAQFMRDKQ